MGYDEIPDLATIGTKYGLVKRVRTKEEASKLFDKIVAHTKKHCPDLSDSDIARIEKYNIGYYAGYFDKDTAERIWQLFECEHPMFKTGWPSPDEAFRMGVALGKEIRKKRKKEAIN